MRSFRPILFFILAGFLVGCQTRGNLKANVPYPIPDWVTRTPKKEGRLCAVGASEPTFYMEDAKQYAADNARKELARSLELNIKTIMVDTATDRGDRVDEGSVIQVSSWATSAVLRESRIMEYWYDEEGTASSDRAGITYALACMSIDSTLDRMER